MRPFSQPLLALVAAIFFNTQVFAAEVPLARRQPQETSTSTNSSYTLIADYSGRHFFTHFNTFVGSDPTHGAVDYIDMDTAADRGLLGYISHASNGRTNSSAISSRGTAATKYHAYIGVDYTTPNSAQRASVRLEGKDTFSPGTLAVLDVRHVPVADGVWPAVWFLGDKGDGETWPANGGESDWLEWVHASDAQGVSANSMTLHTAPGCVVGNASVEVNMNGGSSLLSASGTGTRSVTQTLPSRRGPSSNATTHTRKRITQQGVFANTNCNAGSPQAGTTGCGVVAETCTHETPASLSQPLSTSALPSLLSRQARSTARRAATTKMATTGPAFNAQRGGLYIHWWTDTGVTVWLFARDNQPADLRAGTPDPASWKQVPLARFAATSATSSAAGNSGGASCDFTTSLAALKPIINIDFCGDWAGAVWASSGAAKRTGVSTCAAYVASQPDAFRDAYFEIASFKVFGKGTGKTVGVASETDGVKEEDVATVDFPIFDGTGDL